jgi:tetratricopeptide (TPR) repeat protein
MLGPLPAGAVRALFSAPGLADIIITQTSAAPFPVTEVITALAARQFIRQDGDGRWRTESPAGAAQVRAAVDAAVGEVISGHIAGLTTGPRGLLTLLALLGRPAPPALLADASGRELADVLDGLARLAASGLSQPGPDGWTPGHERISQVLTATLDPASKACVHARLAQALRHRGAEPAEIAGHLLASGDRDEASAAYAAAATRRLGCFADDEALRLADAGLSLQPTGPARRHLLETRAETRRRRGMLAGARADLKAALEACDDAADRSRILTDLALLEARSVSVARGEELAELAIAEAQDHPGARGQALATAAIIDLPAGNLARAERHLLRARRLLEQVGETRGTARLLYCQAMASYMAGRLREAATRLGDLAHLPVIPAEVRLWSPQATRGHVLALLAEPEAGLAEITEALTWARAHSYPAMASECLWRRSEALAFAGRPDEAAEAAEEALAIATRIGHAACTAGALRGLGIAWETAGKTDQAEVAFRGSLESAEGNPFFAAWASARLGACLARQGRPREAEPHVQAALSTGTPLTRYEARWAHAELLAARGNDQACRTQAADALRAAREGGCLVLVPHLRELAQS